MSFDAADLPAVVHFLRVCGAGVVATVGDDAEPQASYVALAATDEGVLVFDAASKSRKVGNIGARPRIAVAVTGAEISVQLEGTARVTEGAERRELGGFYSEEFPDSRAMDDGFVVIAVDVDWVRVCDAGVRPARTTEATWPAH